MGVFLIIFGWLLIALVGGITFYRLRNHKKEAKHSFERKCFYLLLSLAGVAGIGGILTNIGYSLTGEWKIDVGHTFMSLFGAFFFFAAIYIFFVMFYLRYWRTDLPESYRKYIGPMMVLSPILATCAFLLAGEGIGPYLHYPLVSGFVIGANGFHWSYPRSGSESGLHIQWYGVLIVAGAFLAYKISDHNFYKRFGKHGILDTVFLVAFPAGVICARIWYVVGNWNGDGQGGVNFAEECAKGNWWRIFAIWEGGLTILGGAVGGILIGALFFIKFRKYADLRFAFDAVVPNILIAQAIGRFGNFFNYEVFGQASEMSSWPLVPTWIRNNMATGWFGGSPISTEMYAPLFFIEAVFNILGFFLITQVLNRFWKKGRALGDCLGYYLIWYGVVRIIMEPMRDPDFNMGADGMWSIWNAAAYIIMGVLAIAILYGVQIYRRKKGLPFERGELAAAQGCAAPSEEKPAAIPVQKPEEESDLTAPKPIRRKKSSDDKPKGE